MKIGVICLANQYAGLERFVKTLTTYISKKGDTQLLINSHFLNTFSKKEINETFFDLGIMGNRAPFDRISLIPIRSKLKRLMEKRRLYLLNGEAPLLVFSGLSRIYNLFIPILHGFETTRFLSSKKLIYKLFTKPKIENVLDNAPKIISVGKALIKNLPEKYKKKTVVIPNGVDSKTFKPLKNIKQKKNVVLFVGRFIDIKGIKEIMNVAKQLPKYEFWFAGQGELSNLINLSNTKNLGFQTTEELVELYNKATICIFPSWHEPFGLVGLEAMSCSRSVIATSLGFSEYIENKKDGIIIPAKNETALKNAIVDLMKNSKKRKILEKNARKKALEYSWDKIAKKYLKVFEGVVKK